MKPGRELDVIVAEKVMGWTRAGTMTNGVVLVRTEDGTNLPTPRFSTYIGSAWEVVEMLGPRMFWHISRMPTEGWHVSVDSTELGGPIGLTADADTAPHAICLAALAAVGAEASA